MTIKIHNEAALLNAPAVVIFDLDNTLFPYDAAHHAGMTAAESKVCDRLGLEPARFRKTFLSARQTLKNRLAGTASSHNRLIYFQILLEQLGLNAQVLLALDLEQTYWRAFLSNARIFPGAKGFIRDLRGAGLRTALLTDLTTQIQFRKLIYFGIDQQFDAIVTSEEAGQDKPARVMFDLVCAKLECDDHAGVWMIGDNPVSDIAGAKAYGLTAIQKLHPGVEPTSSAGAADASFDQFDDLRRLFARQYQIGAGPAGSALGPGTADPE